MIVTVQTGQMGAQLFNERENQTRLLALVFPHQLHPGWVESFITVSSHYSNVRRYEFKKCTDHTPFFVFESLAFQSLLYQKHTWRASFHISLCSFCL